MKSIIKVSLAGLLLILSACKESPTDSNANNRDQTGIIQEILDQTNLDTLIYNVRVLTGEIPVNINGVTYLIRSRHKDQQGNALAADLIEGQLTSYGLHVGNQFFGEKGRNVYGIQVGTDHPDQYYIICAHYDAMPDSMIAPGADDNASGTAAVIEAARILKNYNLATSVIYALWDEEEQGLLGAINYAYQAREQDQQILGVINLDMIGWDSNDDGRFWLNVRDTANSVDLANRMLHIHNAYRMGLAPQVLNPGGGSDNIPFWYYGFAAIGIEEMYGEDWNVHYHLTSDRIEAFNLIYFHKLSQLTIATTASLAGVGSD